MYQLDTDCFSTIFGFAATSGIVFYTPDLKIIIGIAILILLLAASALISACEVAYFSLKPEEIVKLKTARDRKAELVIKLHEMPDKLLSTILVANNTINITIVLLAAFLTVRIFD